MKPMQTLLTIFIFFVALVIYKESLAVEWNQKPVVCGQWPEIQQGLKNRGEILLIQGTQQTAVYGGKDYELSDIAALLPMSIWVNPKTKTYTILEFHPTYQSHCIISFGIDWRIEGEQL